MALDANKLSLLIQEFMKASGFDIDHQYSKVKPMTDAIAMAVVQHIKEDAEGIPAGEGFRVQ